MGKTTAETNTCNAVTKVGSKVRICELPLHHQDDHLDGDFTWARVSVW